jgi:hypothetical protein
MEMDSHKPQSIQDAALVKATAMLRAAGIQFKIVHEGIEYGDLPVIPKPEGKVRKNERTGYKYQPHYQAVLDNLKPEGVAYVPIPDDIASFNVTPEMFSNVVGSACWKKFGKGNFLYTLSKDKKSVEVMRVA